MSLGRVHKISSKETFAHVFLNPDLRFSCKNFSVIARKSSKKIPRLGVALKKKNIKLSVHRNLIKRKIKIIFMLCHTKLPALDFVIMSSKVVDIKSLNLEKEITLLLDKCCTN